MVVSGFRGWYLVLIVREHVKFDKFGHGQTGLVVSLLHDEIACSSPSHLRHPCTSLESV